MAVNTCILCITLCLCITGSKGVGELTILYSPVSLKFTGSSSLKESLLKDVFLASLGLSVNETSVWKGLTVYDPFNIPEAVVEIYVDGVTKLGDMLNTFGQNYPLDIDDYQPDTFQIIKQTIISRYPFGTSQIIAMHLSNEDEVNRYSRLFGRISQTPADIKQLDVLTVGEPMDDKFLSEINVLKKITEKVNAGKIKSDNMVDFYTFRIVSLHQLSLYYGKNAAQTIEAKEILNEDLRDLTDAFVKAYKGAVLVAVVTTDVCHTRRQARSVADIYSNKVMKLDDLHPYASGGRALRDDGAAGPPDDAGGMPDAGADAEAGGGNEDTGAEAGKKEAVDPDLPLRTNLLLWFTICYVFILITVVYLILGMQPDKDSIIYRMTTSRTKKEH